MNKCATMNFITFCKKTKCGEKNSHIWKKDRNINKQQYNNIKQQFLIRGFNANERIKLY